MQFWTNFREVLMVGASPHIGEPNFFFFGNNRSNRTTDMGKVIFTFVVQHPIPWKVVCPEKLFFFIILENIVFLEKVVIWKIFKTLFLTKKFIFIFVARHALPLKMVMSSHKWFFKIFST